MLRLTASLGALASLFAHAKGIPLSVDERAFKTVLQTRGTGDWHDTLSQDTGHRLDLAQQHLHDDSVAAQAFRNDTIMRINIEREALELSLVDLSQAFGQPLPASRSTVSKSGIHIRQSAEDFREETYTRGGAMTYPNSLDQRSNDAEDFREETYNRAGTMGYPLKQRSNDAEDFREETYTRGGAMTYPNSLDQRNNDAEDFREETYNRAGTMGYPLKQRSNDAEDFREETYTRGGAMTYPNSLDQRSNDAEDFREETYTRGGAMTYPNSLNQRSDATYSDLLDRKNLALGAIERINIAHRVVGKPEITFEEAKELGSHGDEYVSNYWNTSMAHGGFWTTDQAISKPNFIEGGQVNGFGFTQSTFHKLHCLANLRMILAWHIAGNGEKMTRDMNVHTIHCLEYIRGRELLNPDLNEEPIDTVDYKGMGIH